MQIEILEANEAHLAPGFSQVKRAHHFCIDILSQEDKGF